MDSSGEFEVEKSITESSPLFMLGCGCCLKQVAIIFLSSANILLENG